MYQTTAEIFAEILARDSMERASTDECIGHEILSVPNGQVYGETGHIPCDHTVIFYYPEHVDKISQFGKNGWSHHPAGFACDSEPVAIPA